MQFNAAAMSFSGLVKGENGALMKASSGKHQVNAFAKFVRDITPDEIHRLITPLLKSRIPQDVVDAFLLAFHKRNCRGGEGEKDIFVHSFFVLHWKYPETTMQMIDDGLIEHYGSFKDLFQIWERACMLFTDGLLPDKHFSDLVNRIASHIMDTLPKDLREVYSHKPLNDVVAKTMRELDEMCVPFERVDDETKPKITLCGKYCPSENSAFDKTCFVIDGDKKVSAYTYFAKSFGDRFLPDGYHLSFAMKVCRKILAVLRATADIPEIRMCANEYSLINYEKVPSRATTIYRKAFLNEDKHGHDRSKEDDRIEGAENFERFIKEKPHKVKGGQLTPDELITKLIRAMEGSTEASLLMAQYESLRLETAVDILKMIFEEASEEKTVASFIPNILPMADVSGSMTGRPMDVAVSLTIFFSDFAHYLIDFLTKIVDLQNSSNTFLRADVLKRSTLYQSSAALRNLLTQLVDGEIALKISAPVFRSQVMRLNKADYLSNTAISFTEKPSIFTFSPEMTIKEKYAELMHHVGYSTNFKAAMDLVKTICLEKGVIPPTLVPITDEQFDSMNRPTYTYGTAHSQYPPWETSHRILEKDWKSVGLELPVMVYWNVRANTSGVQVDASHPGVQMLAGYSPSMMKAIMRGAAYTGEKKVTPWETFRMTVDASLYDPVRDVLYKSHEGVLRSYRPSD